MKCTVIIVQCCFHIFCIFSPLMTGLLRRISSAPSSRQSNVQRCSLLQRCIAQKRPPQRQVKPAIQRKHIGQLRHRAYTTIHVQCRSTYRQSSITTVTNLPFIQYAYGAAFREKSNQEKQILSYIQLQSTETFIPISPLLHLVYLRF